MPQYFIAEFGEPYGNRSRVEDGVYPVARSTSDFNNVKVGDTVLIYCTNTYPKNKKQVVGQGQITQVSSPRLTFWYAYQSLTTPVPRIEVLKSLDNVERGRFEHLGISYNWLIQISSQSYDRILKLAK